MQILWLVKTTLPQAAAACGLAGASDVSGSWLTGQLAALQAHPALHLTVLCVGKAEAAGRADGVDYRIVTGTAAFAPLLQQLRPDLVHIWGTEYDAAAAMAEAAKAVADHCGDKILYISVANNLSVDCDCDSSPEDPKMGDIGILASLDPVALDKACVDMVYASPDPGKSHLIERMESRHGIHTLEHAEAIGLGSQQYRLVELK